MQGTAGTSEGREVTPEWGPLIGMGTVLLFCVFLVRWMGRDRE